jgi:hypothetical protein
MFLTCKTAPVKLANRVFTIYLASPGLDEATHLAIRTWEVGSTSQIFGIIDSPDVETSKTDITIKLSDQIAIDCRNQNENILGCADQVKRIIYLGPYLEFKPSLLSYVVAHECGHMMGLAHYTDNQCIMFPNTSKLPAKPCPEEIQDLLILIGR